VLRLGAEFDQTFMESPVCGPANRIGLVEFYSRQFDDSPASMSPASRWPLSQSASRVQNAPESR